ncbi:MAG: VCBS repeat-containing protein, partial [Myxococcales bacterium]|nr:VCBS repeat-containing protein [Myxococcales bacterium]
MIGELATRSRPAPLALALALACNGGEGDSATDAGITTIDSGTTAAGSSSSGATDGSATDGASAGPTGGTTTDGVKYDVGPAMTGGVDLPTEDPPPTCKVVENDGFTGCREQAPPDSFEPEEQWKWLGPVDARYTFTLPLVANLTDDNNDGEIDLCDTPDVIVTGYPSLFAYGKMYVLDGATGEVHYQMDGSTDSGVTPALGDIDGDGLVEIIAGGMGTTVAYNHDGSVLWTSPETANSTHAVALADLDNDGDVEILMGSKVLDHEGKLVWSRPEGKAGAVGIGGAVTAADLDGDGDLEVVMGASAWFHDGELFWLRDEIEGGFPQVANFDDDPYPEIIVSNRNGISVLEHDGEIKFLNEHPTPDPPQFNNWIRPGCVHDFDGDGKAEFAMSSANNYSVFKQDLSVLWMAVVSDQSGVAAGTAFDFIGNGIAEAMYGDEDYSLIFDGESGEVLLQTPRTSRTLIEYPVVAD